MNDMPQKRSRKPGSAMPGPSGAADPRADDTAAPATRVLRQFRLVFNAVKTHFQQVEKKAGVGGAQLWAMSVVRDRPGIGVRDLSRAMDVHQSTASNLVKGLVERDMLATRRDEIDRRAVQLRVTPAGARALKRAPGPLNGVLPDALGALDAATLKRLERDLSRLIETLGADERGAGIPLGQTARPLSRG